MPFTPNIDPDAKPGLRVKLLQMHDDPRPVDSDMEGVIESIDSLGTLRVRWDDGRTLGLIPGVDEYLLYPPKDQQITDIDSVFENDASVINRSMPKPTLRGSKSTTAGKNLTKNWKKGLSKTNPKVRDIKVEADQVKGGKADKLSVKDLAKKHDVSVDDIKKEIKIGLKIEMEHTDDKTLAREIAMDHVAEFSDYYSNEKYGTIASEKGLEKDMEEDYAGSVGAFVEPLGGVIKKKKIYEPVEENRIIKFKNLLNEVNTENSRLRDGGGYDGNAWVGDKDGDGWNFNEKSIWTGGEIIDILATSDINWKDKDLSVNVTENKIIKASDLLHITEGEGAIHTKKWDRCVKKVKKNSPDVDPYAVCTDSIGYEGSIKKDHRRQDESINEGVSIKSGDSVMYKGTRAIFKRVGKPGETAHIEWNDEYIEVPIRQLHPVGELDETTTFGSVWGINGPPVTPAFAAPQGKHTPSKTPIYKGGKIVQKVKSDGVLNEVNKIKWVSGGKFVKIKDKCAKYDNQEWCDAGNASDPLELSDTTFNNVSEVSKKLGVPESVIIERIKMKLGENK